MKGIYWRTLTFKKSVIYLIKVNYTPCNSTWTCLKLAQLYAIFECPSIVCTLAAFQNWIRINHHPCSFSRGALEYWIADSVCMTLATKNQGE